MSIHQHPFERILSVSKDDVEFEIRGVQEIWWQDFWLNPRKLRGSDFLMRWSQGVWSEKRLTDAVNSTKDFFAIPYGPSGTAPTNDVRAFELYFERLEKAGLGRVKRPDLLIYQANEREFVEKILTDIGGYSELPFIPESEIQGLVENLDCQKVQYYRLLLSKRKIDCHFVVGRSNIRYRYTSGTFFLIVHLAWHLMKRNVLYRKV